MKKKGLVLLLLFNFFFNGILLASNEDEDEKLKISFSERTRLTVFDNSISLSDNGDSWAFSRHKTSLGARYTGLDQFIFKVKLTNESRVWFTPKTKESRFDEVFVDQLYVKWSPKIKIPLDLTLGRQNILFDEGFICLDGQPLTGSRSIYFNAIRFDMAITKAHKLSGFYSYVPQHDDMLPIVHEADMPQALEEQANVGLGLYYHGQINSNNKLSLYYFLKKTEQNDSYQDESTINAIGARLHSHLYDRVNFTFEGAYQFGKLENKDRRAFGGYAYVDYELTTMPSFLSTVTIGSFYLSGDDPDTEKVEGWDPLWSRWPKWSESYIYTLIIENKGKVAYWSNISSVYASFKATLSEKFSFQTAFHHLMAVEDNTSDFCSGSGKSRGNLLSLRLNYKIDKNWSGHFLVENFQPGNFYAPTADSYNWFRFELLFKI